MKRYIILMGFLVLGLLLPAIAQKKNTYTASNGMVYSVGDTIVLGVGSAPDGFFNTIYSGMAFTIFASLADETDYDFRLPDYFHGAPVVIRKIKMRDNEMLFLFDTDGWGGYVIEIEQAIANCEVSWCRPNGFLTQEEFEKLILLYRAVLNDELPSERFEVLRRELLNGPKE